MPAASQAAAAGQLRPGGARLWAVRLAWLGFGGLAALLALDWAKFAYHAYLIAVFPGQMDYGEGIVWQQALLIPGPRMYGDVQRYPFIVFHYPPLYHLAVRATVAALGLPWLMAGRLVSTVSAVALAALAGALVFEASRATAPRRAATAGAILAALLFASLEPVQFWATTMRVDLLAIALEFLGMYLGLLALCRPRFAFAAALVFVLAAYTKQTAVAGAVATFAVLLLHRPRRALGAALLALIAGGAIFGALTVVTGGGFPRHIVLYNVNRFSLPAVLSTLREIGTVAIYPIYILVAAVTAALVFARAASGRSSLRSVPPGALMIALYTGLATVNLVSLGKSGAWSNYLIPWVSSWALLIGLVLQLHSTCQV
jgi:hypothetical protein